MSFFFLITNMSFIIIVNLILNGLAPSTLGFIYNHSQCVYRGACSVVYTYIRTYVQANTGQVSASIYRTYPRAIGTEVVTARRIVLHEVIVYHCCASLCADTFLNH